jgi:hypothetical protein
MLVQNLQKFSRDDGHHDDVPRLGLFAAEGTLAGAYIDNALCRNVVSHWSCCGSQQPPIEKVSTFGQRRRGVADAKMVRFIKPNTWPIISNSNSRTHGSQKLLICGAEMLCSLFVKGRCKRRKRFK